MECKVLASGRVCKPNRGVKARSVVRRLGGNSQTLQPRGVAEIFFSLSHPEPASYDPKEFELSLGRARPRETLVEARSCPNVKIGNQTQVKRR